MRLSYSAGKHKSHKNKLRLVGIVLFGLIIYKVDFGAVLDCLAGIDIAIVGIVLFLNFFLLGTKALRWNSILRIQHVDLPFMDSFLIYYSGSFWGVTSPSSIGEFVKALYLKAERDISLVKGILSVLVDRLLDMYLLVIIGMIGVWKLGLLGELSQVSLILIIAMVSAPLLLLNRPIMRWCARGFYNAVILKKFKAGTEKFSCFWDESRCLLGNKLLWPFVLTCGGTGIVFIQCYLLGIAMHLPLDFMTITFFMAVSRLLSILPVSISGLGVRDAVLVFLFAQVNLKPELAVSFSLLVFTTLFVFNGFLGALAWWIRPLHLRTSPGEPRPIIASEPREQ
jgi:hypothetical protein